MSNKKFKPKKTKHFLKLYSSVKTAIFWRLKVLEYVWLRLEHKSKDLVFCKSNATNRLGTELLEEGE